MSNKRPPAPPVFEAGQTLANIEILSYEGYFIPQASPGDRPAHNYLCLCSYCGASVEMTQEALHKVHPRGRKRCQHTKPLMPTSQWNAIIKLANGPWRPTQ